MFSRIRKRFTLANVAMTLALVFAMSGGAYAAGKYVITSTKQIKPSVLKQLKGKEGIAGKEGPAGSAGPAGLAGSAGKEGPVGKEGKVGIEGEKGIQGEKGPQGAAGPQGPQGIQGAPGAQGATGQAACSAGANGCELPMGASEHGQWVIDELGASHAFTAVSFVIPLQAEPKGHFIGTNKELAGEENESPAIKSGECTGSATKPEAASGNLCVFAAAMSKSTFGGGAGFINNEGASPLGVGKSGTLLNFTPESATEEATARGVWVVTG